MSARGKEMAAVMSRIAANGHRRRRGKRCRRTPTQFDGYVVAESKLSRPNSDCWRDGTQLSAVAHFQDNVSILVKYPSHMRSIPRLLLPLHNR